MRAHVSPAAGTGRRRPGVPAARPDRVTTIVVADADPDLCATYRQWLSGPGVEVHEALDGREALVRVHALRPQALVADVQLSYIDGAQLCALLREDSAAAVHCVMTTSDPSESHARLLRDCGADVVLVKPVDAATLVTAVRPDGPSARRHADDVQTGLPARAQAKVRRHERYVSTAPPRSPPHLRCPQCDCVLQYDRSHVGGVSERHPEQWDYYLCVRHGVFQYRHRTRRLRPMS